MAALMTVIQQSINRCHGDSALLHADLGVVRKHRIVLLISDASL
jgi:hypothetical protein